MRLAFPLLFAALFFATVPPRSTPAAAADSVFAPPANAVAPEPAESAVEPPADATCSNQLWLISTRGVSNCACGSQPPLSVSRYECGWGWETSSLDEFFASDDPRATTAVFLHGNDIDAEAAVEQGQALYRVITAQGCRCVRMVIWSWPSNFQRGGGVRNDAIVKFVRTNVEPFLLAPVLDRIHPQVPLTLIGYSYGARITTGTLHLLGGGAINGQVIAGRVHPDRLPIRAMLLAAGVGSDVLMPGRLHGQALTQVDRMVVTVNPGDRVLKLYPVLVNGRDGEAMGVSGPVGVSTMGDLRFRLFTIDASRYVHKHHLWSFYQKAGPLMASIQQVVTSARTEPASSAATGGDRAEPLPPEP